MGKKKVMMEYIPPEFNDAQTNPAHKDGSGTKVRVAQDVIVVTRRRSNGNSKARACEDDYRLPACDISHSSPHEHYLHEDNSRDALLHDNKPPHWG